MALCSYGLRSCGLCSYGLCSYGRAWECRGGARREERHRDGVLRVVLVVDLARVEDGLHAAQAVGLAHVGLEVVDVVVVRRADGVRPARAAPLDCAQAAAASLARERAALAGRQELGRHDLFLHGMLVTAH